MAGDFKNDPLLRTILVVLIGILAFGILFNSFSGGVGTMGGENMGNTGSYGISFENLITGLVALMVRILVVVLVIALMVGLLVWINRNFLQNTNSQFVQSIKNNPILKTVTAVTLVIVGIVLLLALLSSFERPWYGFGTGFNPVYSIAGLITLLIQILTFVLVISLMLAVASYLKSQYERGNLNFIGLNKNQGASAAPAGNGDNQQQQPPDNNTISQ